MRSKILFGIVLLATSCLDNEVPSFDAQLAKDVKAIDDYIAANPGNPTDIIIKDASGIRFVITTLGTGKIPPNYGNNLKVGYTGRLLSNGAIFDSNTSFLLKLSDDLIDGWKLGISLLTQGAQAKLYIPSGWGYGETGSGTIPANANLVFDINLIDVVPTQQQQDRLTADKATIDAYLSTNSITAEAHESGIRYVVNTPGAGGGPALYSQVKVSLKGKLLTEGTVVLEGIYEPSLTFSSRVVNYPHGVLVGMQLMAVGGKSTFYVPSGLVTNIDVPANSIVVFEVELLDVID